MCRMSTTFASHHTSRQSRATTFSRMLIAYPAFSTFEFAGGGGTYDGAMKNSIFSSAGKSEPGLSFIRFAFFNGDPGLPGDFAPPFPLPFDAALPAVLAVFFVPRLLALPRWELEGEKEE